MAYYNECPRCGAHLDPGEHCDCQANIEPVAAKITVKRVEEMLRLEKDGQFRLTGLERSCYVSGSV